jgi:hypothetical protein
VGVGEKGIAVAVGVDVTDPEALEAWLRTQPKQVSVLIASRAALQVLPLLGRFRPGGDWPESRIRSDFLLRVSYSILNS